MFTYNTSLEILQPPEARADADKLTLDSITTENTERRKKMYFVNFSPLERSEKDGGLLHLQCNSQKISDFL